jgi:lambda family phage tail tape measure protein
MSDVIGKGVIEVSADATKLKAGIDDAKRSIKSFGKDVADSVGTASARASKSIDNYVRNLQTVAATNGKSTREIELYKLALKGASEAQLGAASNALKMNEAYEKGVVIGERLKTGFLTLAAAASAAAVASVSHSIALLDSLDDISEKTGITVEKLSELRFAGEAVGTKFEDLQVGIRKLSKLMAEAAGGNKEAAAFFDAIGVSATDSAGKLRNTGVVLEDIASKFASYKDGAGKAALAQEGFGKSGETMIPFLNQGASGIRALGSEAKQLGAIYSGDLAKSAADFNDNLTKIKLGSEAAAISLAGPLIGALAKLSAQYLQAKKDGDSFLPTLGAIAQYATLPGQFTLLGQIASGKLFKPRDEENDSENARLLARSKSLKDTIAKVDAPVIKKPEPKTGGGGGKVDNSAAQEAKHQLTADIDEIRKAGEALSNTIANSEKVMEAKRQASLISESEYYQQKRDFIQQNEAIQAETSQKEIARLQQEVLTGKDKIDNDRKIADAQAKIAKIRQNSTADLEVLAIKEKDSLDTIARAYVDARAAAQSYLDVTNRARQLEVEGMGKGNKARDFNSAISQITERYEQQRQDLQRDNRNGKFAGRQADFDRELALLNEFQAKSIASYTDYYKQIEEKQKDFALGASEALKNYYDESQNVFAQTEQAVTNAFKGMEDALVDFVTTGKLDFKSLVNSIVADIARIAIKQSITGPLANLLSGALGGGSSGGGSSGGGGVGDLLGTFISGLGTRAIGGPVSPNSMYRVNEKGPELLSVAGKQYLMTGSQAGQVSPNSGGGGGSRPIVVNYQAQPGESTKTASQNGAAISRQLRVAEVRNS